MKDTIVASSEDAAASATDRRLKEQLLLLMLVLVDSLFREDSGGNWDALKDTTKDGTTDLSVVCKELMIIAQRMLDAQLRDVLLEEGKGRTTTTLPLALVSSSSVSFDQQLMDNEDATAEKKNRAVAKKKRNRGNKATAKRKKTKLMAWLHIVIVAFSSITTLVFTLSLIHQSDGSGEGKSLPSLPLSPSKFLRGDPREHQSKNEASTSSKIMSSSIATVERDLSTCVDTPNWKDVEGDGCEWYEDNDIRGCPEHGTFMGEMGSAVENCCYCGGGGPTYPFFRPVYPTYSPTYGSTAAPAVGGGGGGGGSGSSSSRNPTATPTMTSAPTTCLDTPFWKDSAGDGCKWYEDNDEPLCPEHGNFGEQENTASKHCCHCGGGSQTLPPTTSPWPSFSPSTSASPTILLPTSSPRPSFSPSVSANPTELCENTLGWKDKNDEGCNWYEKNDKSECPKHGSVEMGSAAEHCCFCGGGIRTCEDSLSLCHKYFSVLGFKDGVKSPLCAAAESCHSHYEDVEDVTSANDAGEIVAEADGLVVAEGLYNEYKCDFWSRLCKDTGEGVACDYAAEYCCGDYHYILSQARWGRSLGKTDIIYANCPTCYCDFYSYSQNEFGHTLKPKAIVNRFKQFSDPCGREWRSDTAEGGLKWEKESLKTIYEETNGQRWTNNTGWMNDTVPHCQWYGISCNENGFVNEIILRDNNLEGLFPVYTRNINGIGSEWRDTKYGLANLYSLETLDLSNNQLIRTVDYRPLYNLITLTHFDVSGNQLSGVMDALVTPSITHVNLSNNRFETMLNFNKVKRSFYTLRSCDMSYNPIQADATILLENIPPNIEEFKATKTSIYGNLPASLNSLPKLRRFDVSSNVLSGELPVFADSALSLQELDVSNQEHGLNGSISEDIWKFQPLTTLNLAGNKLTGTIPPEIVNLVLLGRFDVSNNRFSGQIPSQIGLLEGTLKYLGLANNTFSGTIPSNLGQIHGAAVFLKGNSFDTDAITPLSLCTLDRVEESDLADDITYCAAERTALSTFYDSAKGAEWTTHTNWKDEHMIPCAGWYGVKCVNGIVTELSLRHNGLSGKLSESIGQLSSIAKLDLSDNDIKGSIPKEIGQLSKLTYLRLSYNAFTGTAPVGLANLTNLKLLQLQGNRIIAMPNIQLEQSRYKESTFITDCGVPSAFEKALDCEHCTMCCNADQDCQPQGETRIQKFGLNNVTFAVFLLALFTLLCCRLILFSNDADVNEKILEDDEKSLKDDTSALGKIGKDSVYSYFVTKMWRGWFVAILTLALQCVILVFFILSSEANLQDDNTDIKFTWQCPRDSEVCDNKSLLNAVGWIFFCLLMICFLAKDMVNGLKLIHYSSKKRHSFGARVRYFIGGLLLSSITIFALYVSTVYNIAIATDNTDIILNAVIVLFVMDVDEKIFAALHAANEKWTAHAATATDIETMKKKIASLEKSIASIRRGRRRIHLRCIARKEMKEKTKHLK